MGYVTGKGGIGNSNEIVGSSKTLGEIGGNIGVLAAYDIVDHVGEGIGVGEGVGEIYAGVVGGGHAD